ncbi:Activating signal cointegrator 1-like Protein [Tribolium castaneum]|uniref:Activating signal cointegrator 1-like Protein n=1 Tax=Tribolium castaneum TaxID=7070 RepID=D6WPN7_TRICA|nr:PREDICTED: activating signal cointegrator 1 [Tribolium castaneum]EFA06844.2 Activating signal cointegrator 1-like Protein [Tribolium castaneum]|eukprot:XP_008195580.1 PREDICTED: activating signal cointegrator 1 [Tribolium castaneum]
MGAKNLLLGHLKVILGNHVESDIVDYIHSIKNKEDLDEFMENIIDKNNTGHVTSYEGICNILFGSNKASKKSHSEAMVASKSQEKNNKAMKQKGKKRFSDINAFQEKKKQQEGRTMCDCEGQEHEFMNNCLNCGRIHCYEEGPGPCFFCNEPVTLMGEENYVDLSSSRKSRKSASVTKHKENTVFDDDNDYFKTDSNQNKQDKRTLVVALDFATRRVIESTAEDVRIKEKLHEDIKKHLANVEKLYRKLQKESEVTIAPDNNDLVDLLVQMRHKKPVGVEDLGPEDNKAHIIDYGKVYDEEVIANTDHGLCLSMHQPYASLLVAGVKKHEGRTWKTNHRGRLWIAAAAKVPDEDEISALETFYRHYYNDQSLKFPRDYPTSCLLGCVFVEDCLDQETYRKRFPNGESNSPYVLICSNPVILPIFYPILGKHKIYPLDKELHNCAKLSLRHANYFD